MLKNYILIKSISYKRILHWSDAFKTFSEPTHKLELYFFKKKKLSSYAPFFLAKPLPKDHKWEYIGGGLGGGAMLIIVVIVIVSVVCYRSKLRSGVTRVKVIFHSI